MQITMGPLRACSLAICSGAPGSRRSTSPVPSAHEPSASAPVEQKDEFPLYTDADVHGPLILALRRRGWDLIRAIDLYPPGAADALHFDSGSAQGERSSALPALWPVTRTSTSRIVIALHRVLEEEHAGLRPATVPTSDSSGAVISLALGSGQIMCSLQLLPRGLDC